MYCNISFESGSEPFEQKTREGWYDDGGILDNSLLFL